MDELNDVQYTQWVKLLEQRLVEKYRHSVRNLNNHNPVFNIDDIRKDTRNDGFAIQGIDGSLLLNTLSKYSKSTNYISVNLNKKIFQLTEEGKKRMIEIDPQIE